MNTKIYFKGTYVRKHRRVQIQVFHTSTFTYVNIKTFTQMDNALGLM